MDKKLLAKSRRNGREVSLQEHSYDTAKAAELIFRLEKRWGRNWCRFFRISETDRERFLLNLKIAALLHKPTALQYPIVIDYLGFNVPNKFLLGFGLDYDGLGRNLAEIYQLIED